jgi:dTDP-4-dehydrorhamnose reductase
MGELAIAGLALGLRAISFDTVTGSFDRIGKGGLMKQVFIVGATGYIGGLLLKKAKEIYNAFGTSSRPVEGMILLRLDAPDQFNFQIIKPGDVVFFTAAISAPDVCAAERNWAWSVNVNGTANVIGRALDRGARVIFFSSDAAYGEQTEMFDEEMPSKPVGEYAEMKSIVERKFIGSRNFKTIRLSYVFSRHDKFTQYLWSCSQADKSADVFHPFFRAVVHRNDVIDGALALAARWADFTEQVINFGGPDVISRVDYACVLRNACMPKLQYKVTTPEAAFFQNRPPIIAMQSPILAKLLDRLPRNLQEAAQIEFSDLP